MQRPSVFSCPDSACLAKLTGLVLALAMAASACGAGSSTEAGADDVAAEFESPLGDFLGWTTDFNNEDEQAKYQEIERQAQEAAAVCMKAEGFEYIPVDYGQFENFSEEEEGIEWGTRAWGEKYGFGISTQRFSQEEVGPDLVGHSYGGYDAEETFVDPNEAYVESLPEAEQQVYYETLYGKDDGPEYDPALTDEENDAVMQEFYDENYEPTGCMNVAYQEASGEDSYQEFDELFSDKLQEMEERFESDPRVAERQAEVSSCVTEKGFEYTDVEGVYEDVESRMGDLGNDQFEDPFNGVDPETLSDEEIDAIFADMNALSDEDRVELAVVQEYELGLAAAVMDCSNGAISSFMDPVLVKIRVELEQEFLDNNADELERFKGTMGG